MSFALIFDGIALCVFLFFVIRGMLKGFVNELIGLVGFFISLYCAWRFNGLLVTPMMQWFPNLNINIATLICGAAIFISLTLGITLFSIGLSKLLSLAGLSTLDHLLGILVGAIKTFSILLAIYGTCMTFSSIVSTDWMLESYAMRTVAVAWPPVRDFLIKHELITPDALMGSTAALPSYLAMNDASESQPASDVVLAVPETGTALSDADIKAILKAQESAN